MEQQQDNIESLAAQLLTVKAELMLTLEINQKLTEQIDQLSKSRQVPPAQVPIKANNSDSIFTLDGQAYGFKKPALNMDGRIITPAEVLASQELQKKLVTIKSGFIYPL